MTGDGETVNPSLPEPDVWTGMAQANVLAPLRWKRAKIHRGSRRRILGPHQEAGYTSAVVTVAPDQVSVLQLGGVAQRRLKPISAFCRYWRSSGPCEVRIGAPKSSQGRCNVSGSLALLAAMRRPLLRVNSIMDFYAEMA
jgi:hypothetical protein